MAGSRPPVNGDDARVSASEEPTLAEGEAHSTDGSAAEDSDRLGREFARLTAKVLGRAREEAEDILAEARSLRQEEPLVGRRTVVYGLAGLLKAGDVISAHARDVAAQARAVQASARAASGRPEDAAGSQDVTGSQSEAAGNMSPVSNVDISRAS